LLLLHRQATRQATRRAIWKLFVVFATLAIGAIALGAYRCGMITMISWKAPLPISVTLAVVPLATIA
jgi:NADH:ubiquinone oxidoreductase subunit H